MHIAISEAAAMPTPSYSPSPSLISAFPTPLASSQSSGGLPTALSMSTSAQAGLLMVTVIVASLSYSV